MCLRETFWHQSIMHQLKNRVAWIRVVRGTPVFFMYIVRGRSGIYRYLVHLNKKTRSNSKKGKATSLNRPTSSFQLLLSNLWLLYHVLNGFFLTFTTVIWIVIFKVGLFFLIQFITTNFLWIGILMRYGEIKVLME